MPKHGHAGAKIVFLEGGVGIPSQHRRWLRHRPGIALDLGFELDRRVVEIFALEGLVGGERRDDGKSEQRGSQAGADDGSHGMGPPKTATTIIAVPDGVEVMAE